MLYFYELNVRANRDHMCFTFNNYKLVTCIYQKIHLYII